MSVSMDVVVTTHNDAEFLREALLSIIYGSRGNNLVQKIVVVDDASRASESDIADKIVDELRLIHSDIILVRNSGNCGLSHSRNRGLRFCSAEYVTFLDADDLKPAGWGATVKDILEAEKPDYLFTASALIDDQQNFLPFYDEDRFSRLFKGKSIQKFGSNTRFVPLVLEPQIGNKYFKLDLINKYLFPIGQKFEDLYLISRITLDIDHVLGANVITHLYNMTERSSRVTMMPKLKGDIIANLAGLSAIYTHYFDSKADKLQLERSQAGSLSAKNLDRHLGVLDLERQLAFAALKCAFARMLDWSINTIGINDVEAFADRAARVLRSMPINPSVAKLLSDVGDPATFEWYDDLVNILINGDRGYLGQVYA